MCWFLNNNTLYVKLTQDWRFFYQKLSETPLFAIFSVPYFLPIIWFTSCSTTQSVLLSVYRRQSCQVIISENLFCSLQRIVCLSHVVLGTFSGILCFSCVILSVARGILCSLLICLHAIVFLPLRIVCCLSEILLRLSVVVVHLTLISQCLLWYDGHVIHLWWKSTWGVVADEPYSDLQVSSGDARERRSNSEIVAWRTETWY